METELEHAIKTRCSNSIAILHKNMRGIAVDKHREKHAAGRKRQPRSRGTYRRAIMHYEPSWLIPPVTIPRIKKQPAELFNPWSL